MTFVGFLWYIVELMKQRIYEEEGLQGHVVRIQTEVV